MKFFKNSFIIKGIFVLLLIVPLIMVVVEFPKWQIKQVNGLNLEKKAELEDKYRLTLIQSIGGLFFIFTAYSTWRNLQTTERKQITDQFSKAVELLSEHEKIESRLGGIPLLGHIAKDSPEYHWTVMEFLSSYVREKSIISFACSNTSDSDTSPCRTDIQSAVAVIGQRSINNDPDGRRINLANANLVQLDLRELNFARASLCRATLNNANMSQADFSDVDLTDAILSHALLWGCNLRNARLIRANLVEANLSAAIVTEDINFQSGGFTSWQNLREGANLSYAELISADLNRANLSRARLNWANCSDANFTEVDMKRARCSGTIFHATNLSKSDLSEINHSMFSICRAKLKMLTRTFALQDFRDGYWHVSELLPLFVEVIHGLPFAEPDLVEKSNLRPLFVHSMRLHRANLTEANLSYANFRKADLYQANLSNTNLEGVDFSYADLYYANFNGAKLDRSDLSKTRLFGATFVEADLDDVDFRNANISHSNFKQSSLSTCDFTKANLEGANLSEVNFYQVKMCNTNLSNANISREQLNQHRLEVESHNTEYHSEIEILIDTRTYFQKYFGWNFYKNYFCRAKFQKANLSNVKLSMSNFKKADFRNANLIGAELQESNFKAANLSDANLSMADLSGANLKYANLKGANLSKANLCNVKGLTVKQIKSSISWQEAIYDIKFGKLLEILPDKNSST